MFGYVVFIGDENLKNDFVGLIVWKISWIVMEYRNVLVIEKLLCSFE